MLRLIFLGFLIVVIGMGVLSIFSDELAGDLLFFSFGLLAAAVILKLLLDISLHYKKESVDHENLRELLDAKKENAYYSIQKYKEAIKRRYGNDKRPN